jgi:hypothetical protein
MSVKRWLQKRASLDVVQHRRFRKMALKLF